MFGQAGFDQWRAMIMQHLSHLSMPQTTVLALWSFGMGLARSCALSAVSSLLAAGMQRSARELAGIEDLLLVTHTWLPMASWQRSSRALSPAA